MVSDKDKEIIELKSSYPVVFLSAVGISLGGGVGGQVGHDLHRGILRSPPNSRATRFKHM